VVTLASVNCSELESMSLLTLRVAGVRPAARSVGRNRSSPHVDQRLIEKKLPGEFGDSEPDEQSVRIIT
jgi:hypothetical protein